MPCWSQSLQGSEVVPDFVNTHSQRIASRQTTTVEHHCIATTFVPYLFCVGPDETRQALILLAQISAVTATHSGCMKLAFLYSLPVSISKSSHAFDDQTTIFYN
eukprot:scpid85653/ scgid21068/ 